MPVIERSAPGTSPQRCCLSSQATVAQRALALLPLPHCESDRVRATSRPGFALANVVPDASRHFVASGEASAGRPQQARRGPRLGRSHLGECERGSGAASSSRPVDTRPDQRRACGEMRGGRHPRCRDLHPCRRVYANQARSPWLPMSGGSSMVAISRASRRPFSGRRSGSQDFAGRNEKRLVLIALIHDGAQLSL